MSIFLKLMEFLDSKSFTTNVTTLIWYDLVEQGEIDYS